MPHPNNIPLFYFIHQEILTKILILSGLIMNLIASVLIGYGRIFRSKKTIKKESQTRGDLNVMKKDIG
jgi:hypothetical protein